MTSDTAAAPPTDACSSVPKEERIRLGVADLVVVLSRHPADRLWGDRIGRKGEA